MRLILLTASLALTVAAAAQTNEKKLTVSGSIQSDILIPLRFLERTIQKKLNK